MPSKKRKYNARFPSGRIKKIMQTDEEVGKVAQAVPIIISRTLELFVESLLRKALLVTTTRNAKTLSPSHVKQCILSESRFDFLRDLVKNIPDVSAAEEKEMQMSAESSPISSRFPDAAVHLRVAKEDSNSSSSCDVKSLPRENHTVLSAEVEVSPVVGTSDASIISDTDTAIDLTKRSDEEKLGNTSNVGQEPLVDNVIPKKPNVQESPLRTSGSYKDNRVGNIYHKNVTAVHSYMYQQLQQPSASSYAIPAPLQRLDAPNIEPHSFSKCGQNNNTTKIIPPLTPFVPAISIPPILNIDFTQNLAHPKIRVLETQVSSVIEIEDDKNAHESLQHNDSKVRKSDSNNKDASCPPQADTNLFNTGNLQIDEDYDT